MKSPGQLTLTCYATCRDINHTITPDFKCPDKGIILYIDLGEGCYRIGGTALSTVYGQLGDETPDVGMIFDGGHTMEHQLALFRQCFECIQRCLQASILQSGHDRSDGGLIVTVLEMAFAGNVGCDITLSTEWYRGKDMYNKAEVANCSSALPEYIPILFGEELGFVFEVLPEHVQQVCTAFGDIGIDVKTIGRVTSEQTIRISMVDANQSEIVNSNKVKSSGELLIQSSMHQWRNIWESTSFALESLQCNADCVAEELANLSTRTTSPPYHLSFQMNGIILPTICTAPLSNLHTPFTNRPRVAVLRQEGSNGDKEMLSAFHTAGFEAWDVNMQDMLSGDITLNRFRGLAFCGGFSYADVNGSAKGWAAVIKFNTILLQQFEHFYLERSDTFSLGVCNGCQLMMLLGLVPFEKHQLNVDLNLNQHNPCKQVRLIHNSSGRFESRWSTVRILPSPAVLLRDMAGSTLGIWTAHGEGKFYFPDPEVLESVQLMHLAPVRYVNDSNQPTESYPFNPNGSPLGIAALCSLNGRHLALMPHPERCFLKWQVRPTILIIDKCIVIIKMVQIPYMPQEWKQSLTAGPWLKLFQNAKRFCDEVA